MVVRISNDDIWQPIAVEIANCNTIDVGCHGTHEYGWKKRSRMGCVAKRDCDIGHAELWHYKIEYTIIVDVRKNKTLESGDLAEISGCAIDQPGRRACCSA